MNEKNILQQIVCYINGELNEREKDKLWEEFLKNPEYLDWLEIEVNLRDACKKEIDKTE